VTDTGSDWALYEGHRIQLTRALSACAPEKGGRLCLLGAGKCNDVDLERLSESFSEIHLVDIDPSAVASAVARQTPAVRARLRPHVPVDLSGLTSKRLGKWQRKPPTRSELEAFENATLAATVARLPSPFDVVASACILTQIAFALSQSLGEKHPALGAIRQSLITTHLRSLVSLTRVGGTSLFACDVASSTTYPLDALPADRDLDEVLRDVVASGASYFAANPKLIRDTLRYHPDLAEHAGEPEPLTPWLWTGPLARTYLVYALRFARL
jgi:hypothetical protein